jgi:catechol 2,3-dioxygenase-like lactoylglutathione lyase family enzyme
MTTTTDVRLSQIGQISVNAQDINRATEFYRDILGVKHLFNAPPNLAFFDCDGVRLMLTVPEREEFRHPGSILYFKVDDINAVHESLLSKGVRFDDKPHLVARMKSHDLWMAFFRDSENNLLCLMSEVARS